MVVLVVSYNAHNGSIVDEKHDLMKNNTLLCMVGDTQSKFSRVMALVQLVHCAKQEQLDFEEQMIPMISVL